MAFQGKQAETEQNSKDPDTISRKMEQKIDQNSKAENFRVGVNTHLYP